uniref:Uncharacterized protein n=1 Tax=uncultured marine virus TaxID=186617 RepID=A0A0F7L1W8_9VIRU|nr:hypothetical protein [uncultured marine virus]
MRNVAVRKWSGLGRLHVLVGAWVKPFALSSFKSAHYYASNQVVDVARLRKPLL